LSFNLGEEMFNILPKTVLDFKNSVMWETLGAIKTNTLFDNYDPVRAYIDKSDNSCVFHASAHAYWIEWFLSNYAQLYAAYSVFFDEYSKRLFLHLLAYRMGGHLSVRLPVEFDTKSSEYGQYINSEASRPSEVNFEGLFELKHFNFEWKGKNYKIDSYGLEYYLFRRQYFFERGGVRIQPEIGDHVIDGGACTGDSALVFAHAVGETGLVYAFDPVLEHLQLVRHNIEQSHVANINPMPYGLADNDNEYGPISIGRIGPDFNVSGLPVPLRSLDRLVKDGLIPRVDFIKLDVEGSEASALSGALDTIEQMRPKLAVSLYHKPDDLFSLILLLRERFPFYDFFLGHYTIHHDETVLYAMKRPK
jgi:FkbM family methyltransferase